MHRNVEVLIGRLATDSELRRRFARQPFEALREQRLELTEVEIAALAAIPPDALRHFAAALDTRLRKASLARPEGSTTRMESASGSSEEIPS